MIIFNVKSDNMQKEIGQHGQEAARKAEAGRFRKFLRELKSPKESLARVATETTSWRLSVLLVITPAITYAVTHKLKFSLELPFVEIAVKYPLQVLHGKLWSHLSWGYKPRLAAEPRK